MTSLEVWAVCVTPQSFFPWHQHAIYLTWRAIKCFYFHISLVIPERLQFSATCYMEESWRRRQREDSVLCISLTPTSSSSLVCLFQKWLAKAAEIGTKREREREALGRDPCTFHPDLNCTHCPSPVHLVQNADDKLGRLSIITPPSLAV